MSGTIVTDRIESDATYDSKIELASPVLVSNTFAVKSTGGTGVFNIVGANTNTDRTFTLPDNTGTLLSNTSTGVVTESMIANTAVTQAKLATAVIPIGVGQTYQSVLASRSPGVTYTNTTGKPIFIHANGFGSTATNAVRIVVDGITMRDEFDVAEGSIQAIVPNNSTYVVHTPNGINEWVELR